jgi:hypothetical protein
MTSYQDQIADNIRTEAARAYWNGAVQSIRNEYVDILLTDGLDAAVDALEETAAEDADYLERSMEY